MSYETRKIIFYIIAAFMIALAAIFVTIMVIRASEISRDTLEVFGDSEDPFGNCYHYQFPYWELCKDMRKAEQQAIKDVMDKACKYNQSWCVTRVPN